MTKIQYKTSEKAGLPPGTLIHVGKKHSNKTRLSQLQYSPQSFIDEQSFYVREKKSFKHDPTATVTWKNIDGLHNVEFISAFEPSLHPLTLEDILNTKQRPKIEEFEEYLYISVKMFGINQKGTGIIQEQISLVLKGTELISFQEQEGDIFDGLRERIALGKGNIRKHNADYLLYRILDTIVDHYFLAVDFISEKIDALEDKSINDDDPKIITEIQQIKKQLINLRRQISPLREITNSLEKDGNQFFKKETAVYIRDVHDHLIQLVEGIEIQKDILSGARDSYLSAVSNKMNKTMQFLTAISCIFIPLTFLAGIYGMNFEYIPELQMKNGYYYFWIINIIITSALILVFKRKKWF